MSGSDSTDLLLASPQLSQAVRSQQLGQALLNQGMDTSPIYSPWQGVNRLLQSALGGLQVGDATKQIQQYGQQLLQSRQDAANQLAGIMGGSGQPQAPAAPAPAAQPAQPQPAQTGAVAVPPPQFKPLIDAAADKYGVPHPVAYALLGQESNFGAAEPNNIGNILPQTAANPGYGVSPLAPGDISKPAANIDFAMHYLAAKAAANGGGFGNPQQLGQALLGYNGGGDPNYVQNVEARMPGGQQMAQSGASDVPMGGAPAGQIPQTSAGNSPVTSPQAAAPSNGMPSPGNYSQLLSIGLRDQASPDPYTRQIGQQALSMAQALRQQALQSYHTLGSQNGQVWQQNGYGQLNAVGTAPRLYGDPQTGYSSGYPGGPSVAGAGYRPTVVTDPQTGNTNVVYPSSNPAAPPVVQPITAPGSGGSPTAGAPGNPAAPGAPAAPRQPGALPMPASDPYQGLNLQEDRARAIQSDRQDAQKQLASDNDPVNKDKAVIALGQQFQQINSHVDTGGVGGLPGIAGARALVQPGVQNLEKISAEMKIYGLPTGIGRMDIPIVQQVAKSQPGMQNSPAVNTNIINMKTSLAARDLVQRQTRAAWASANGGTLNGFDQFWNDYNNNVPALTSDGKGTVVPNTQAPSPQQWAALRTGADGRYVPAAAGVPDGAIQLLKQRPDFSKLFDQKYGDGVAERLLGQ